MTKIAPVLPTPIYGQKLYNCWNGELQTVLFREQSIVDGAYAETWLVYDPKRSKRIRCSVNSYYRTPGDAYRAELKSYQTALTQQRKQATELRQIIKETKAGIVELKEKAKQV